MELSYILNILGEELDGELNPVSPPIYQTSNFYFKTVEDFRKAITSEKDAWIYSRGNNPTVNLLCKKLAALELAEDALVFGSGMAAISSAILANVGSGDHIICIRNPYSWTDTLLNSNILPKFRVDVSMVDGTDTRHIKEQIKQETRLIYLESPNSWTFELQDLDAISNLAAQHGIITIIDNSYATPLFQQPILHGIDLVCHTASKYLGGHSDVVAGVICGSKPLISKIFHNEFLTLGGILSPFNAWLLLRGLRTLPVRMDRVARSTKAILDFLINDPRVGKVYHPFLATCNQTELARKQMSHESGLITIQTVTKNTKAIEDFCNSLTYWRMAVSWGGYESLVIPSCTFVRPGLYSTLPDNLIRFSVGLEDPEVLIRDLGKGFDLLHE